MASKGKVLLTGGSGFIASHVLDTLLDDGFTVVVTARSAEKGQKIVDSVDALLKNVVSYVVVGDVAEEGAFDTAVQTDPPFDYVIHTASPYHLNVQDPVKEFLDPAIKGTTGILKSIKAHAPSVKRVVITSSSAAMLNPLNHAKVYDESHWSPWTWEMAIEKPHLAYATSKKFAEKAAWDFVSTEKPGFDLSVINNTYTFGPVQRQLASLDAMNASNHRIRDLVTGRTKAEGIPPTAPVFTFVDVRDVALAHVRALTVPEAGGKRFYAVSGHFSNKRVSDVVRRLFPQLDGVLPPADAPDDFPDDVYGFDNTRTRELLGIKYRDLDASVGDTVESILRVQAQEAKKL